MQPDLQQKIKLLNGNPQDFLFNQRLNSESEAATNAQRGSRTVTEELISFMAMVVCSGCEYVALHARAHALTSIVFNCVLNQCQWRDAGGDGCTAAQILRMTRRRHGD